MKDIKRILAIIGIVLLVGLYLSTLFFALFENPNTYICFRASVIATIAVPVLIYAYTLIFKYLKQRGDGQIQNEQTQNELTSEEQTNEEQNRVGGSD